MMQYQSILQNPRCIHVQKVELFSARMYGYVAARWFFQDKPTSFTSIHHGFCKILWYCSILFYFESVRSVVNLRKNNNIFYWFKCILQDLTFRFWQVSQSFDWYVWNFNFYTSTLRREGHSELSLSVSLCLFVRPSVRKFCDTGGKRDTFLDFIKTYFENGLLTKVWVECNKHLMYMLGRCHLC